MRIHTSLTESDIREIVSKVHGVTVDHLSVHRSRSRDRGIELRLHGTSPRKTMMNTGYAATWDEWGVIIANVFDSDGTAIVGPYKGVYAFEEITQWRFHFGFTPTPGHAHRWEFAYPFHFQCKSCDAQMSTESRFVTV